ncbi:MAG TPA: sulfotransferase [Gaiellaceae bacterium]|nr:sulfotransferase [Gaiellaceae bacterium]
MMDELETAQHHEDTPVAPPPPRGIRARAVLVAGMHRSGTSAITRVLNLLGLDLPDDLYAARADNPLGYWEPRSVVEAHDQFLADVHSSFDDPFRLPEGALEGQPANALRERVVEVVTTEFAESRAFVVKDPRLCRLLPVWLDALATVGVDAAVVLPVRNPLEVAASLKIRNEFGATKSFLLWLRHVLEAELHSRNLPRAYVSYEDFLRDWHTNVTRIADKLGLVWTRSSDVSHAEIESFLSPRRRHHDFAQIDLAARSDVSEWVKSAYEIVLAASHGNDLDRSALDEIRSELERGDALFGPLLAESGFAVDEARGEVRKATEALAARGAETEHATAERAALATQAEEAQRAVEQLTQEHAAAVASLSARDEELAAARGQLAALGSTRQRTSKRSAHCASRSLKPKRPPSRRAPNWRRGRGCSTRQPPMSRG